MNKEFYANFRNAKLVSLIKVEVNEGEGIPEDATRRICYYINPKTGEVIFKTDPIDRKFAGNDEMYPL